MSQTASKQYIIEQLPTDPGQISSDSVPAVTSAPGYGSMDISWQKVGKLYFNIRATSVSGGFNNLLIQDDTDSIAELISLMGITVNTKYSQSSVFLAGGNSDIAVFNVGGNYWEGTNNASQKDILFSILAN